jgi:Fe-S cluster assembly protein SufB
MTDIRLRAYEVFLAKPMPKWGGDLGEMDFTEYTYYIKPSDKREDRWEDVPENIRKTFDRLGVPEAERKFLAGVGAQYESEMVYHSIHEDLAKKGVIFLDTDTGLKEFPDLFREHFTTLVPPEDNKFAALNTACWSGGSFIYVPKGVVLDIPLQAYFRINSENMGQFERTIIIADEGAQLHYIEGCTAPQYSTRSLHTGVIEIFVKRNAKVRYTTIQNWSHNIYNLVTQRAIAHEGATMEWVDGNMGSRLTMKYPSIYLVGEGATGNILSIAFATDDQHQDAGAKIIHKAKNTSSTITSKSISKGAGRTSYRGLLKVVKGATGVKASVKCDALMLDVESRSDTYPTMEIDEDRVTIAHEATVGKISDEQIYYLQSRGLSESDATAMIVQGFIAPFAKELPMEYAIELNRLIQLEMEGSVG